MNSATPLDWCIGIVGYGEVGRILAEDLRSRGVAVRAYDIKLGTAGEVPLLEHAARHGVALADSHGALAAGADLLLSSVTAQQTVHVARACALSLQARALFLDLNSASPAAKCEAAALIEAAGGRYLEGAVMTSVPPHRIRVPLLLGGPHAAEAAAPLATLGFAPQVGDARPGVVSATKMCRSVVIKGIEAMLIESLTAARRYGVEDDVLASLTETYPGIDWERQADWCFSRVIAHGRRRAEEMREVAQTVREAGLEPWSAAGTAECQAWVAELAAAGRFADIGAGWRAAADAIIEHMTKC